MNQSEALELHKSYLNKDIGFDEYHRRLLELEKNMTNPEVDKLERRVVAWNHLVDDQINDINELKEVLSVADVELQSRVSQRDAVKAELDKLK